MTKIALITLHGGNFVGGSAEWDKQQNEAIEISINSYNYNNQGSYSYDIHQLDFPTDNYEETMEWLEKELKGFKESGAYKLIFVLGRSSGGYLAKQLFERNKDIINGVFYIAPVFNPKKRIEINTKFAKGTNHFFRNTNPIPHTDNFHFAREFIYRGKEDGNVPLVCFTQEQLYDAIIFYNICTHKGMCNTISKKFISKISDDIRCQVTHKNLT